MRYIYLTERPSAPALLAMPALFCCDLLLIPSHRLTWHSAKNFRRGLVNVKIRETASLSFITGQLVSEPRAIIVSPKLLHHAEFEYPFLSCFVAFHPKPLLPSKL